MEAKKIIESLREAFNSDGIKFTHAVYSLAGNSNERLRCDIMHELTGSKLPKSKCGINNLISELKKHFGS